MSDEASGTHGTSISRWKLVLVLLFAAGLLVTSWLVPVKPFFLSTLEMLRDLGAMGLIVLAMTYTITCVLILPGSILTLGAGFIGAARWPDAPLIALFAGAAAASLGSTTGATAAFLLGRTMLRDMAAAKIAGKPRFRVLDDAIGRNGFKMVFLVRLSPAFPFNVLNYALGLTQVRLRDYVLASWLGMLPGTLLYVYLGATAQSLAAAAGGGRPKSPQEYAILVAGLIATLLVVVLVARIARKSLSDAIPASPAR